MKGIFVYISVALIVAVVSIVLYLSLAKTASPLAASAPVVASGDTIHVYYTGTFTNGTQFDSNVGKQPLEFTVGAGQLIRGFDQGVIGMKLNETKTITIPANEAYGEVNPNLMVQLPISDFQNQTANQTISKGMVVTENSNGRAVQGIIKSVNATTVTIDFNPPLAGKTLIFEIKVVSVQSPK